MHYSKYTALIALITLQLQLKYFYSNNYTTLHYTTPPYTTLYTTTTTLDYATTTLHYTTLHPAAVGDVTTATTPKSTAPTTFRSISGFALPSMHDNNAPIVSYL